MPDRPVDDLKQVGISEASRAVLARLQETKPPHIDELLDGYRLGIAVAIAFGREPRITRSTARTTIFSVASLDPDGWLKAVITEVYPESRETPYRAAEDLAEQGLEIVGKDFEGDEIWFASIMDRIKQGNLPVGHGGDTQVAEEQAS
jgi:hypothetical protein